ncbi:DUF6618 family protein [Lachnospiraceae bacterium 54-53]
MKEFICIHKAEMKQTRRTGSITGCKGNKEKCEFELQSRSFCYHLIIGKYDYANYVCVPNWEVGCKLADYGDLFWNTERLAKTVKNCSFNNDSNDRQKSKRIIIKS